MKQTTGMNAHACPVDGCTVEGLPYQRLMCYRHWKQVPRRLQNLVYETWNDGAPLPGYILAREAAILAAIGGQQ